MSEYSSPVGKMLGKIAGTYDGDVPEPSNELEKGLKDIAENGRESGFGGNYILDRANFKKPIVDGEPVNNIYCDVNGTTEQLNDVFVYDFNGSYPPITKTEEDGAIIYQVVGYWPNNVVGAATEGGSAGVKHNVLLNDTNVVVITYGSSDDNRIFVFPSTAQFGKK